MRVLALDIGDRRVGIAVSDPDGILASPLAVIENDQAALESIASIIEKQGVGAVVVGLPRTLRGEFGGQAEKVQKFVNQLRERISVPVETRSEIYSTALARRLMHESPKRRKGGGKTFDDAAAAAVILQAYLDEKRRPEDEG